MFLNLKDLLLQVNAVKLISLPFFLESLARVGWGGLWVWSISFFFLHLLGEGIFVATNFLLGIVIICCYYLVYLFFDRQLVSNGSCSLISSISTFMFVWYSYFVLCCFSGFSCYLCFSIVFLVLYSKLNRKIWWL